MYTLIQLLKEQLSLVVTQCLFHASTTSGHAQLRPEAPLYSNFALPWRSDIMKYSCISGFLNAGTYCSSISRELGGRIRSRDIW